MIPTVDKLYLHTPLKFQHARGDPLNGPRVITATHKKWNTIHCVAVTLTMRRVLIGVVLIFLITQIREIEWRFQAIAGCVTHWQFSIFGDNNKSNPSSVSNETITYRDNRKWILETNEFQPNRYQRTPYVSNGYIGQRLPAEGAGFWIDVEDDGEYAKNCKIKNLQ